MARGMPMMMRVWEDFVDNNQNHVNTDLPTPAVAIFINVKVTTHHGPSLSTMNNSSVFHNPPIANASSSLEWEEAYGNTDVLLPGPTPDMIMPITDVLRSVDEIKAAWVYGTLQLMAAQEKLWYTSCKNCNKSISSYITWEFTCTSYGVKAPVQQS